MAQFDFPGRGRPTNYADAYRRRSPRVVLTLRLISSPTYSTPSAADGRCEQPDAGVARDSINNGKTDGRSPGSEPIVISLPCAWAAWIARLREVTSPTKELLDMLASHSGCVVGTNQEGGRLAARCPGEGLRSQ